MSEVESLKDNIKKLEKCLMELSDMVSPHVNNISVFIEFKCTVLGLKLTLCRMVMKETLERMEYSTNPARVEDHLMRQLRNSAICPNSAPDMFFRYMRDGDVGPLKSYMGGYENFIEFFKEAEKTYKK